MYRYRMLHEGGFVSSYDGSDVPDRYKIGMVPYRKKRDDDHPAFVEIIDGKEMVWDQEDHIYILQLKSEKHEIGSDIYEYSPEGLERELKKMLKAIKQPCFGDEVD